MRKRSSWREIHSLGGFCACLRTLESADEWVNFERFQITWPM
jgi:hypothetical protein